MTNTVLVCGDRTIDMAELSGLTNNMIKIVYSSLDNDKRSEICQSYYNMAP